MSVQFQENIDRDRFDRFVDGHPLGSYQQIGDWGETLARTLKDARVHRVGIEDDSGLSAVALLVSIRFRKSDRRFLLAPNGPLLDPSNPALLADLTSGLQAFARREGAVCVRIAPHCRLRELGPDGAFLEGGEDNQPLLDTLEALGYERIAPGSTRHGIHTVHGMRVDLDRPLDDVFAGFHRKTRYNIRLAQRRGIEIVEGTSEDLPRFAEMMQVTGVRDGFRTKPLSFWETLDTVARHADRTRLFLARYDAASGLEATEQARKRVVQDARATRGKLDQANGETRNKLEHKLITCERDLKRLQSRIEECRKTMERFGDSVTVSGAIAAQGGPGVWYLAGASDGIFRDLMPNHLLQWEMMRWASARGARYYDLGAVGGSEDSGLFGLTKFKRGFGSEFIEYLGEFDLVTDPEAYTVLVDGRHERGQKEKKLFKDLRW